MNYDKIPLASTVLKRAKDFARISGEGKINSIIEQIDQASNKKETFVNIWDVLELEAMYLIPIFEDKGYVAQLIEAIDHRKGLGIYWRDKGE